MVQTTPNSLSVGGQTGQRGGQLLQELEALNQALYEAGHAGQALGQGGHGNVSSKRLARRETMPARMESEREGAGGAGGESLGSSLRSSHPKPPVRGKSSVSDAGRKGEHLVGEQDFEGQGFEEGSEVSSYAESVDDEVEFRQRVEVPTDKKKGLWSWKPFRALAHVGQQKFNCLFTVRVHGIEGLPASVNGLRLGVHFAKKDDVGVQTIPARVSHGLCEFQESLNTRCSVHGTKNGAKGMKWESKQFVLTVVALDVDEMVLGRHRLDLTRLLPETIEDDMVKQDTWTTSFKLTGKAQGGTLVVTFGCEIQSKDSGNVSASSSARFGESPVLRAVRSFNGLPNSGHGTPSRHAPEDHHSPAMSEPSAEYAMEHLSLDDFNHEGRYSSVKGNMQFDPRAADAKAHANAHGGEQEEEEEEDELQFTVIDKGVEVSTIVDTASAQGYDEFESEKAADYEEKQVHMSTQGVSRGAEDRYEEYEEKDVKDESPGALGDDLIQEKEHVKQIDGHRDSGNRSSIMSDSKPVSRSIDDELEMQELLAALGEQERETGRKEGADTSSNLQNYQEEDLQDDMTEEELLSLLPGGIPWESAKKTPQSKGLESDDELDNVAGEFLSLLQSDTKPSPAAVSRIPESELDSPRALLFKQFEKEAMIESGLGLNMKMPELQSSVEQSEVPDFYLDAAPRDRGIGARLAIEPHSLPTHQHVNSGDFDNSGWGSDEDVELASIMEAAESELQKATQTMRSKNRAKMLEDEETEALMQEWGLNKKVFEGSSRVSSYADETGNSFAMVTTEIPPLGFGLGPIVPVRDGGSLMSMNPYNFQPTSGSKLVMQVSKPVVVPTEMGAQSLDILLRMASSGMDGMSNQAMVTMPLDDITGKSVEQIASEGFAAYRGNHLGGGEYGYPALEGGHSPYSLEYTQDSSHNLGITTSLSGSALATSSGRTNTRKKNPELGDSFASLEDLAPVAMQKIEALALEGLKIQSDMAEEEAPYMVEPFSRQGRIEGGYNTGQGGGRSEVTYLEEAPSMSFLEDGSAEDSGLLDDFSMAISLDEWMRLDAGVVDENDINNDTMALVAAHQASHGEIVPSNSSKQGGKQKGDGINDKGGHMGSTITLAMLVQLRDPLRNFEPIGAPMMALVQAERVAVPPMPKLRFGKQISMRGNNERYDDPHAQPLFKITDVTLSGLKMSDETVSEKKHNNQKQIGWGNPKQQQSGSRWLAASGMSNKNIKAPISKAKSTPLSHASPVPRPTTHPAAPPVAARPAAATAAAAGPPAVNAPLSSPSKTSTSKIDSLWSLSAKFTSRWGGSPSVSKVRNPDVVVPKTGWFGRKK